MKTKYNNVRNWLLSKERYEDLMKFDSSDEAKERFYREMAGESFDTNENARPGSFDNCDTTTEVRLKCIENHVKQLEDFIKAQKKAFDAQKEAFTAEINLFKALLENAKTIK